MLSEQYSQKCLENAHLAQALEAERQALRQCQRENQELNAHNQVRACRRTITHQLHGECFFAGLGTRSGTPCPDSLAEAPLWLRCAAGAEQPSGGGDHQDALHDVRGWSRRLGHHDTRKRALRVRSERRDILDVLLRSHFSARSLVIQERKKQKTSHKRHRCLFQTDACTPSQVFV